MICENHSPREAFPRVMIVFSMVSFFFIASESPKYYTSRPSSCAHGMHDRGKTVRNDHILLDYPWDKGLGNFLLYKVKTQADSRGRRAG